MSYPNGTLLRDPAGTVFVVLNGNRYGFGSLEAMAASGYGGNQVDNLSDAEINIVPNGGLFTEYPDGTLLRNPAGTVFVILSGKRYGFGSLEAMAASGYGGNQVHNLSDEEINPIPDGGIFTMYPNGTLLRNPAGTVFVILSGKRYGFGSLEAMAASGYGGNQVHNLSDGEINPIPDGGIFTMYPNGTLLRDPVGTVFVVLDGQCYGFTSLATMAASGYGGNQVHNLSDGEINPIRYGGVFTQYPNGTLLRSPAGTVFVMLNGQRRGFPSLAAMAASGYGGNKVYQVSDNDLKSIPMGPPFPDVPHPAPTPKPIISSGAGMRITFTSGVPNTPAGFSPISSNVTVINPVTNNVGNATIDPGSSPAACATAVLDACINAGIKAQVSGLATILVYGAGVSVSIDSPPTFTKVDF